MKNKEPRQSSQSSFRERLPKMMLQILQVAEGDLLRNGKKKERGRKKSIEKEKRNDLRRTNWTRRWLENEFLRVGMNSFFLSFFSFFSHFFLLLAPFTLLISFSVAAPTHGRKRKKKMKMWKEMKIRRRRRRRRRWSVLMRIYWGSPSTGAHSSNAAPSIPFFFLLSSSSPPFFPLLHSPAPSPSPSYLFWRWWWNLLMAQVWKE